MKRLKKMTLAMLVLPSFIFLSSTSTNNEFHPDNGNITAAEFKGQLGLIAWLDDFDFDAHCTVDRYTLLYTPKREDPVTLEATGGAFKGKMNEVIKQAKPGDQYAFVDVHAKCPGDTHARKVNSLYFKIR